MLCNKLPQHLVTLNMYYNLKFYLAASGSVSNKTVTVVLIDLSQENSDKEGEEVSLS